MRPVKICSLRQPAKPVIYLDYNGGGGSPSFHTSLTQTRPACDTIHRFVVMEYGDTTWIH